MSGKDGRASYTFADGVNQPLTYKTLGPKVWVLGGLMVVTAIVTLVLILQDFSSNSYLYLLFYAIPANSAVSVFPHEPVVIYFGSNGNVLYTAVAASLGTVIAGFLDHSVFVPVMNLQSLAGYKDKGWYQKIAGLFMKYPFLVIVVTGAWQESNDSLMGAALTAHAFSSALGDAGAWVVGIGLTLFAFSTIIAWSYYGDRSAYFLFGERAVLPYRVCYTMLVVIGAAVPLQLVWNI